MSIVQGRGSGIREPGDYPAVVNGKPCRGSEAVVPAFDDGLLRGDGCFEYVRAYRGRPFKLAEHLDRMERSCANLRLDCPREALEADVAGVAEHMAGASFDLRLVLTRGGARLVLTQPVVVYREPVKLAAITDVPRPVLIGAKSLSYGANMLALRLAAERGYEEALLVTPEGQVLEMQTGAFFWVSADGRLCTPPLATGILDSITRRILCAHLEVQERPCPLQDALAAPEVFAGSTAREIHPVAQIEEQEYEGVPGPVTREALRVFWREVAADTGLDLAPYFDEVGAPPHARLAL